MRVSQIVNPLSFSLSHHQKIFISTQTFHVDALNLPLPFGNCREKGLSHALSVYISQETITLPTSPSIRFALFPVFFPFSTTAWWWLLSSTTPLFVSTGVRRLWGLVTDSSFWGNQKKPWEFYPTGHGHVITNNRDEHMPLYLSELFPRPHIFRSVGGKSKGCLFWPCCSVTART